MNFAFDTVASILVEDHGASNLGAILKGRYKPVPCFVVTDKGLRSLGLLDQAISSLKANGFAPIIYDDVVADPPEASIHDAVDAAKQNGCELVIGFGGGSSMDVAKLVAVLLKGQQDLSTMYGIGQITSDRVPLVQIPTTSGTGSEVTPISIVTTGETTKMGVVDPILYADLAILDATLTLGLPAHVTAATGIDAMVHALEAYTTKHKKNPISDALARQAFSLLGWNILRVCSDGKNLDARRDMLIGAMLAGQAFANAPVAAVHALAYPLGGHFHVPHGLSNSLVLPYVMEFNMEQAGDAYGELAAILDLKSQNGQSAASALVQWFRNVASEAGIETRLRDVGVKESDLDMLADDAMLQTRLLVNNPREVTRGDAYKIYEATW
ncbi:iron-containing alcohol dehydrogenase [Kordiimonas sp. SCSIO 12610]|uniref:iron-containing alcohol dehydrogenase n=1 Tax=Kordiimonas sp. SCSIO 12610 TaxID=2829597 RepID=UPI00210EB29D|nr:iron-containing alcohol dehydrogenase [Kordiimonas sp. SCSIO 12610]UTW56762.1 iron-containing alcohol dehydrogenase [Kordiimonas sp. SCSIO 12610]